MSPRIVPGRLRELGPINWVLWRGLSVGGGTRDAQLFSTLGRTKGTFRGWLHFYAGLLPGGALSRHETELIILRVAHLRESDYEMDHHIRLGRRVGVTAELLERVLAGPSDPGWSERHRSMLTAVDALIATKDLDDAAWSGLAAHFDERGMIEFLLLVERYDMLATVINTLRIERDTFRR